MATKRTDPAERLLVEIGNKRLPLMKILHGKEIREAMAALEKFRQQFNEQEFLLGAKVYLSYNEYHCWAIIKRPETDKEYAARQLYLQEQQQKKAERLRLKQLKEYAAEQKRIAEAAARKAKEEAEELARALEIAQKYGYRLVDKLDS